MSKIAVFQWSGGRLGIAPIVRERGEEETKDEFVSACFRRYLMADPDGTPLGIHEAAQYEQMSRDKTFRDAWTFTGGKLGHDMEKAREIQRDRLRVLRAPKLAALDIDYQRADERGDVSEKSRIAEKKRALRDVTKHPDIEAAVTPEALKAVIPDALK